MFYGTAPALGTEWGGREGDLIWRQTGWWETKIVGEVCPCPWSFSLKKEPPAQGILLAVQDRSRPWCQCLKPGLGFTGLGWDREVLLEPDLLLCDLCPSPWVWHSVAWPCKAFRESLWLAGLLLEAPRHTHTAWTELIPFFSSLVNSCVVQTCPWLWAPATLPFSLVGQYFLSVPDVCKPTYVNCHRLVPNRKTYQKETKQQKRGFCQNNKATYAYKTERGFCQSSKATNA